MLAADEKIQKGTSATAAITVKSVDLNLGFCSSTNPIHPQLPWTHLPTSFDIFEIYRQYLRHQMPAAVDDCCMPDESQKLGFTRAALSQLLEVVESKVITRVTILEEAHKLMLRIGLMADFSEFSCFYDFVFFICRENGQKNITVSRAVMAWRSNLAGRF